MGLRYRTNDLPAQGVGAFMPIPAAGPVASSYGLVGIAGAPGDVAVPTGDPLDGLPSLTASGGVNSAQSSAVSPDVFFPSVYIPSARYMGPEADAGLGMTRRRFAELPVPAVDPTRIPTNAAAQPGRLGGRSQVGWPRSFQRFPNRGA